MQLMRQKIKFTAFGLLSVDYTLIFTVSDRLLCNSCYIVPRLRLFELGKKKKYFPFCMRH